MNIVLTFDSFKGCLSSEEIAYISKTAIKKVIPDANINSYTVADGGEGTLEALVSGCNGKIISSIFTNLEKIKEESFIGLFKDTCIIECAQTVGLTKSTRKDVQKKTSMGMGEQIKYALDLGYRKFAICLGGSGTNDIGLGLIGSLGYKFLDSDSNEVKPLIININRIARIDSSEIDKRIYESEFIILSDVHNPLCGSNGATYVYGPQKGVTKNELESIDKGIFKFSKIAAKHFKYDKSEENGAGAAGGLGYAVLQFLNGHAISGVDYVLEALNVQNDIEHADLVFTGEGRSDSQTANGKVAVGVSKLSKKYNKPVILISGSLSEDAYSLHNHGIDYITSIQDTPADLEHALKPEVASKLLSHRIEETMRLIVIGSKIT